MGSGKAARLRGKWWFGSDPCVYCGAVAVTVDHITPASFGGWNHWANYAPACRECNRSRGNRSLLMWLLVLDYKRRAKEACHRWQSRSLKFKKKDELRVFGPNARRGNRAEP